MARVDWARVRRRIEEECGGHRDDPERYGACIYRVLLGEGIDIEQLIREPLWPRVRRALGIAWQMLVFLWVSVTMTVLGPLGAAYVAMGNGVPEPVAVWAVAFPLMLLGAAIWYKYIWEGAAEVSGLG